MTELECITRYTDKNGDVVFKGLPQSSPAIIGQYGPEICTAKLTVDEVGSNPLFVTDSLSRSGYISYGGGANGSYEIDWRNFADKEGFLEWLRKNLFGEEIRNESNPEPKIDIDQLIEAVFEE